MALSKTPTCFGSSNRAIAARHETYLEAGWKDVVILDKGQPFQNWQCEKTTKRNGGKVFIAVSPRDEVSFTRAMYRVRKPSAKPRGGKETASADKDTETKPEAPK